jgi:hypothetical protein
MMQKRHRGSSPPAPEPEFHFEDYLPARVFGREDVPTIQAEEVLQSMDTEGYRQCEEDEARWENDGGQDDRAR